MKKLKLPTTPNSIQKGVPLKLVLDETAVNQLGENLKITYNAFNEKVFLLH